jgi:hypothetical protein
MMISLLTMTLSWYYINIQPNRSKYNHQRWASQRFFASSQVKSFFKNPKSSQVKSRAKISQVKSKFKSSQVTPKLIDWEVRWPMKTEKDFQCI